MATPSSQSHFVTSRKQVKRLAHIVSLLKQGDLTSAELLRDLDESSLFGSSDISCSPRTLRHDIEILRREYDCPVLFDFSAKRYTLLNKNWNFTLPALLNPNELLAIVIGGKISRDIFPPNISRNVTDAVNEIIRYNSDGGFLSSGRVHALKILSNPGEIVDEEVFLQVFNAWRTCRQILIDYQSSKDERTRRIIEPHALVFYDMQWSIRAYCPDASQWRTFLVSRIVHAQVQETHFVPDDKTIDTISADNYFGFPSVGTAQIRLTRGGMQFAKAHWLRSDQQITVLAPETFLLTVSDISEEELLRWTLSQVPGDAIPVAPPKLVKSFRSALRKIMSLIPKQ
ncbi:MAG: WYL domain-containing protein, partial [Victivallales bacterium]|nr:WYL domain-containing protein [Victivallales bacterium]